MARKKLEELLVVVKKEVKKAKKRYKENKKASEQIQETSKASWSAGGDRVYAQGQEEINKIKLDSLRSLENELLQAVNGSFPEEVQIPCFMRLKSDGQIKEIYLVGNVASIESFILLSDKSPFGQVLLGKKVGDSYTFEAGAQVISTKGLIEEIG